MPLNHFISNINTLFFIIDWIQDVFENGFVASFHLILNILFRRIININFVFRNRICFIYCLVHFVLVMGLFGVLWAFFVYSLLQLRNLLPFLLINQSSLKLISYSITSYMDDLLRLLLLLKIIKRIVLRLHLRLCSIFIFKLFYWQLEFFAFFVFYDLFLLFLLRLCNLNCDRFWKGRFFSHGYHLFPRQLFPPCFRNAFPLFYVIAFLNHLIKQITRIMLDLLRF